MLQYEKLLNAMSSHFAKWMDIRKRTKTSNGGKVLQSVADEVALIQNAIDDYKKDFFLEGHIGKEEEIVDYTFRIHIGTIEEHKLKLLSPALNICTDIKVFYANHDLALYQEGWLYIHKEHASKDDTVVYEIYDKKYSLKPQLFHVWNVFDEFAAFLGLRRHEYETNLELEKRIVHYPKKKINCTEDGLKHALLTELLNIDSSLTEDDILIEGVTPENLKEKYKEFDTVLEALAQINKDVYRLKKWDLDTWNYTYHSVDYIPHFWDIALDFYKNGVGRKDDLKIDISKETDTTNAVAMFYKKNSVRASQILEQKKLTEEIELGLTKHNDAINPVKARYKVTASEAVDITDASIYFRYSTVETSKQEILLSDVVKQANGSFEVEDVTIDDSQAKIEPGKYRIKLSPNTNYSKVVIKKIDIQNSNQLLQLAKPNENYIPTSEGLVHAFTKLYANKVQHFYYSKNAMNCSDGVTIAKEAVDAELKLSLANCQNENFAFEADAKAIELKEVKAENFNYADGAWTSNVMASNISLSFETTSNFVTFKVDGKAKAFIEVDGTSYERTFGISSDSFENTFTSNVSLKPVPIKVRIVSTSAADVLKIYDIGHNKFEVDYKLKEGVLLEIPQSGLFLPNVQDNELHVTMKAYTSKAPYIRHINIGITGSTKIYTTDEFTITEASRVSIEQEGAVVEIIPIDVNGNFVYDTDKGYIQHFNPIVFFVGNTDNAKIFLDFKDYIHINNFIPKAGVYVNSLFGPYIALRTGERVANASIEGTVEHNKQRRSLIDIFNINTEKDDKLYISNLFNGFIAVKNNEEHYVKLKDISEYEAAFKGSLLGFENLPKGITPVFQEQMRSLNTLMDVNTYIGAVKDCYLYNNAGNDYIAYNEYNLYTNQKTFDVINTFHPFLEYKDKYLYQVEKITDIIQIAFDTVSNINTLSLGIKKVKVTCPFDKTNGETYGIEYTTLPIKVLLNKNIALKDVYISEDGQTIELSKYIVAPPTGCEMQYITKIAAQASIEEFPDIVKEEPIDKHDGNHNKLTYCNVNEIVYVTGEKPINGEVQDNLLEGIDYEMLREEGIILWKDHMPNKTYYILYTINKPVSITLSDDMVYEKIEYDINGYDTPPVMIDNLTNIADNDFIEINAELLAYDRIVIKCDKAGFRGFVEDGGIRFKRIIANDVISVKSGYYYMDGIEYYMFAQEHSENIDEVLDCKFVNVEKINNTLILRKPSRNHIQNSMLNLKGIEEIYTKNYTIKNDLKGISSLNALTACDNYSHWISTGMNLSFTNGKNGIGIKVKNAIEDGYMYLEITDKLFIDTKLSMYASNGIRAYIGTSDFIVDVPNTEATFIEIQAELQPSIADKDLIEITINKQPNKNYFLIIKGSGIIDDIVTIDNNTFDMMTEYHTKNIDVLNLSIEEAYPTDSIQRLLISKQHGFKNLGAEIDKNDIIINSPLINWGVTKIKDYHDKEDWSYCILDKCVIENDMVVSKYDNAILETEPMYMGQIETIKNLIVKVNEIDAPQMSDMLITVLTSDKYDGTFIVLNSTMNNISRMPGKVIDKYVKIRINMTPGKIVHSLKLFSEYKTTDKYAPIERISSVGTMLTHILDTHHQNYYEIDKIAIENVSNIDDVVLEIRAAKENVEEKVWTDWKTLKIDDKLELVNRLRFKDYRFFQLRVTLTTQNAFIKINHIDAKVVQD